MPNVRGDKRRTIVCPDDLWDGLGAYAAERSTTRGAVIRDQIRELMERPANAVTMTCLDTGAWRVSDENGPCGTYGDKAAAENMRDALIQIRREATESGEEPADAADA
jgi:hypothetical protein